MYAGLDAYCQEYGVPEFVIQGYCRGADKLALNWAIINRIPHTGSTYKALWKTYGMSAGAIRNKLMLDSEHPDYILAFPGDAGTHNMCEQAFESEVPVIFFTRDRIMHSPVANWQEWYQL